MRCLIYNPDALPALRGLAARLAPEPVTAEALAAGAERLVQNGQLPLVMVGMPVALIPMLRRLRHMRFNGPVLVLTPARDPAARTELLYAGADDVLVCPADPGELEARITTVLRRQHGVLGDSITCGGLVFHLDGRHPKVAGREVPLSGREYDILRHLILNADRVVSKAAIYDALYALCAMPPFDKIIDVYICRLRAKIAAAGSSGTQIATVPGRGYCLRRHPDGQALSSAGQAL